MMKRTGTLFVATILAAHHPAALAQSPSTNEPAPGATLEEARRHYERGIAHYNLGAFDAAIAEFKAAYERSSEPDLLFNIAQAYRLKEDYKQALFFYDAYLRLRPAAANRVDVAKRIVEMKQLVEAQRRLQQSPPKDAIPPTGTAPGAASQALGTPSSRPETLTPVGGPQRRDMVPSDRSARIKRISGLVAGGAGVAALTTGTYFGVRARSGWNQITQLSAQGGTWNAEYARLEADAAHSETIATVLIVGGGAALLGGGLAYYLGWRQERLQLSVRPGAGIATLSVTW